MDTLVSMGEQSSLIGAVPSAAKTIPAVMQAGYPVLRHADPASKPVEVEDVDDVLALDPAATLALLAEQQRRAEAAEAMQLRAAAHWAELHRVETTSGVGALDADVADTFATGEGVLGREGELRLAGEGAFTVAEFAITDLAARLRMSESAARGLVGQALELRDRLPRLWARVMAGELPAWRARRIAALTIPLKAVPAAWVDAQVAAFAHKVGQGQIQAVVEAAVIRWDPVRAAHDAALARDRRGVWTVDQPDGNTEITVVTDTPEARAFDQSLSRVAGALGDLGDCSTFEVRRAKAVGILADPQLALELTTSGYTDPVTHDVVGGPRFRSESTDAGNGMGGPVLHIHLHMAAVEGRSGLDSAETDQPAGAVARVTGIGPRPVEAVEEWIRALNPGSSVQVSPVVDLADHISVDAYESTRLKAQLEHRDTVCAFPWCGRRGLLDLDHVEPFAHDDPENPGNGPPPDQTRSDNAALLCRFHHRVKTHSDWTYVLHRDDDGHTTLTWTSPLGSCYAVDNAGTIPHS